MRQVSVCTLKARASELLRAVEGGEAIVVTRHGRPVARLAPVGPQVTRQMGLRGLYAQFAPAFEAVDLEKEIRQLRRASTAHVGDEREGPL